ncbi:DUF547 domain-containing protein [Saprospiraceae bacterium]|nr:DUF547 domain-containing protein [Saprospiraceae bacterium]
MKISFIVLVLNLVAVSIYSQEINSDFFDRVDNVLKDIVVDGSVEYDELNSNQDFSSLISDIESANVSGLDANTKEAFYINAYNLLVINQVKQNYPISSVQEIPGFFDKKKVTISGEKRSLNGIEKDNLLNEYNDARFHFVLVCGAKGCPPITNFAYRPETLEAQKENQTLIALNDDSFISVSNTTMSLSQIFNWYKKDFGNSKTSVVNFINKYREDKFSDSKRIKYTDYDWSLNEYRTNDISDLTFTPGERSNNSLRYVVSSTIAKGTTETKIFNNLYTQKTTRNGGGEQLDRATFFTTTLTSLYGLTNNFNVGINTRYRRVRNDILPSSPFSAFSGSDGSVSSRTGVTAFGPMIRYAPVPKWENFSIQSSFVFAIGDDLSGRETPQPFIDWSGHTWWTQFFNDFAIGNNFSLFTEVDLLIEDIGSSENGHINRVSTPATAIFSYNPIPNMTLYTLGSYSPFWQSDFDYFTQLGVGFKYQFTPNLELELLFTDFSNRDLNATGGQANTYNLGLRINI